MRSLRTATKTQCSQKKQKQKNSHKLGGPDTYELKNIGSESI